MDTRLTLPVNLVLEDGYRIVRVVGAGGFGITYEAEDISLGTRVALKEYYPADFGDRDATMCVQPKSERHRRTFDWGLANFLQEARTLARFEHPSIVQVMRVFEANSTAYMVMRFEQGQNFEAWLQGLGRRPTQEELDAIVAPLLDALGKMHAASFLHRDIAPDNIIVRVDGSPVLLDFGAARRAVAAMSRRLTGIVKAGYSPHEQYATDSRLQGPWSDLFALAATLYRAVTGKPPQDVAMRVEEDRMPSAQKASKGKYRQAFLAGIDACLAVKPADRPQSVAQLEPMLLGDAMPPKPAAERPVKTKAIKTKRTRRLAPPPRPVAGRWLATAAAMLVVMGGAYGGYEYTHWQPGDAQGRQSAETRGATETARRARLEAERLKAAVDTADQTAPETEGRQMQEAERPAATDATQRAAEAAARRNEEERTRLAAALSADERAAFVRRVQQVLKQSRCYDGAINGRGSDAQDGADRFAAGAAQKGRSKPVRIDLAKASTREFETWLNDADDVKGELCTPKVAKPQKEPVRKESVKTARRADDDEQPSPQSPSKRNEAGDGERPGRGGSCSSWMFHNTSCTDNAGRHCTQTPSGRKCD